MNIKNIRLKPYLTTIIFNRNEQINFYSYVHKDCHRITSIEKWASEGRFGNVAITHATKDKRAEGKEVIKQHIKSKIQGATCR